MEQPVLDKTLSCFRKKCYDYETLHGVDLYHDCVKDLSGKIVKIMKLNGLIRRMDSLMIESNIRFLSRMALIYTCISKLVVYLTKKQPDIIPEQLKHYADPNDYNHIFYHQRNDDMEATYRNKAGKQYRGYSANIEETVGKNGSVVTDYQYDKNTHTYSQFLQESLSAMEKSEEEILLVTDGAYDGQDNIAPAKEKNIRLVTTALIGKEALMHWQILNIMKMARVC